MLDQLLVRVSVWLWREEGQDLVEYALVIALISVGIVAGLVLTGLFDAFQGWTEDVAAAIAG